MSRIPIPMPRFPDLIFSVSQHQPLPVVVLPRQLQDCGVSAHRSLPGLNHPCPKGSGQTPPIGGMSIAEQVGEDLDANWLRGRSGIDAGRIWLAGWSRHLHGRQKTDDPSASSGFAMRYGGNNGTVHIQVGNQFTPRLRALLGRITQHFDVYPQCLGPSRGFLSRKIRSRHRTRTGRGQRG